LGNKRSAFRLFITALLLALVPIEYGCAFELPDSHHDASYHDAWDTQEPAQVAADCVENHHDDGAACSLSLLLTTDSARRCLKSLSFSGNTAALAPAGLFFAPPSSLLATAQSRPRPPSFPPITLVALQVLHLN
jgi:hypothetical protein